MVWQDGKAPHILESDISMVRRSMLVLLTHVEMRDWGPTQHRDMAERYKCMLQLSPEAYPPTELGYRRLVADIMEWLDT